VNGAVATIWCQDCTQPDAQPIAYVIHGPRAYWLMRLNIAYEKKRNPSTTNLTKIWARAGSTNTRDLQCNIHGSRTLDLAELETKVRARKSVKRPARVVV
jgi:hypothetical protein